MEKKPIHTTILSYDQALGRTIPKNSKGIYQNMTLGMAYQIVIFFMYMISSLSTYPLLGGMAFLEKVPAHFECYDNSHSNMTSSPLGWHPCTQDNICSQKLSSSHYRAVTTDEDYLDNWVEKFSLLCRTPSELGMLGSCFFLGVIGAITWVPRLADLYGRVLTI